MPKHNPKATCGYKGVKPPQNGKKAASGHEGKVITLAQGKRRRNGTKPVSGRLRYSEGIWHPSDIYWRETEEVSAHPWIHALNKHTTHVALPYSTLIRIVFLLIM